MKNYYGTTIYTDDFMWEVMNIYIIPEYLYHYTSVETMALILKNNTLRFNRLDQVNDFNEALSPHLPHANTAVFASCWTSHQDESIPMWKMYTGNMDGVRVKLPTNMFSGREKPNVFEKGGSSILHKEPISFERDYLSYTSTTSIIQGPNKIHYSDEDKYNFSKTISFNDNTIRMSLYDLGLFKQKCWEYEQEWRFKILAYPNEFYLPKDEFTEKILNLKDYPIKNKFIDVPLDSGIFNEAEFTLGPKVTEAQSILFKSIIEQYSPKAKVKRSTLQIR